MVAAVVNDVGASGAVASEAQPVPQRQRHLWGRVWAQPDGSGSARRGGRLERGARAVAAGYDGDGEAPFGAVNFVL